jgi:hypothetical protein
MPATGVRWTRTAARFGPAGGGAGAAVERGAVAAGCRAAVGGVVLAGGGTAVVDGVDVVLSAVVDSVGDGPIARSRWLAWPPPHAAATSARTKSAAASVRRTIERYLR